MVASFPASIVTHGQALNITCQSYAGFMNFGFTGCHSSIPSMQRLAVYTGDALAELEKEFMPEGAPKAVTAKAPARKAAPAKKATAAAVPAKAVKTTKPAKTAKNTKAEVAPAPQ